MPGDTIQFVEGSILLNNKKFYEKSSAFKKLKKKASRTAVEGIIISQASKKEITFVEVNCETDFVAKDGNFINFCEENFEKLLLISLLKKIYWMKVSKSMEKQRMSLVQKIGENIIIRKSKKNHRRSSRIIYPFK